MPCPVCKTYAVISENLGGSSKVECSRCGKFSIGWQTKPPSEYFNATQIANLSGWIRENQECVLTINNIAGLASLPTPPVPEKANKLLRFVASKHPKPGAYFSFKAF